MFQHPAMEINRREILKAVGAGMAAAVAPTMVSGAQRQSAFVGRTDVPILTRRVPRSSEEVPVVGLGTFMTFDLLPGDKRSDLAEVVKRFWTAGGRVIDTSPLYGMAEVNVGQFTNAFGIEDEVFLSNKIWSTGEYLADDNHAIRSLELSRQRLWRETIDSCNVIA